MAETETLRLEGVDAGYGREVLLKDLHLTVRPGEIVTLIGPNGAGKSTILKTVARQIAPLGGRVMFLGRDLQAMRLSAQARQMAVMLTAHRDVDYMTCRDVVALGRYPYTGRLGLLTGADREKVEEALAAVQAADIADRDFRAISDGQRQRVLLARALAQEPALLVLDEPTSFLDVRHKLALLGILRGLARERRMAVLLSLHEIDLAMKLSDRVVCVAKGGALRAGAPEDIFREELVRELYALPEGRFDPLFGGVELPRPVGAVRTFVIAGGGSGAGLFRRLQRAGVPFAAGILFENDVDCHLARQLAAAVVSERAFQPISDEAYRSALAWVQRADRVLVPKGLPLGPGNARLADLIAAAEACGKREEG